jgi:hypothetical protein
LELFLLFLVSEVVLLVVALAVVVLVGVVVLDGVKLLPHGAVGDEVGGVVALKVAHG